jgi:hypothetical protein
MTLASKVDIKRFFGFGRDILGIRRFSMSIETLRALILLKDGTNDAQKVKKEKNKITKS